MKEVKINSNWETKIVDGKMLYFKKEEEHWAKHIMNVIIDICAPLIVSGIIVTITIFLFWCMLSFLNWLMF